MLKASLAIAAAAILAGIICMLPAATVEAGTAPAPVVEAATADRLDARAAGCGERAWPYYGQTCLGDADGRPRAEARKVRLVTTDRLN